MGRRTLQWEQFLPFLQVRPISTDGGGIRGLILIQVLLNLERVAKQPIVKLFDWIAGTSTGGILALGFVHGEYAGLSIIQQRT
jgi:calcium-independent phospholipase A2